MRTGLGEKASLTRCRPGERNSEYDKNILVETGHLEMDGLSTGRGPYICGGIRQGAAGRRAGRQNGPDAAHRLDTF